MAEERELDSKKNNLEGGAQGSSLHLVDSYNEGNAEKDSATEKSPEQDYYFENGFLVFTGSFLTKRGWCCGNGCRHCPYTPKHQRGNNQW